MNHDEPPFEKNLLIEVQRQYRLNWNGLHGASHWARVLENGLHLCEATPGLRRDVIVLFALLHDACRNDEGHDGEHGFRAASFAMQLQGRLFHLDPEGIDLLTEACRTHTGGRIPAHPTVMACWDSDRLDLPRIYGVRVRPEWLGTAAARDPAMVARATARAQEGAFPWSDAFAEPVVEPPKSAQFLVRGAGSPRSPFPHMTPEQPVLFVSLGTSPAVVPEAFLLPKAQFQAVHVLTTEEPKVQLIRDYFEKYAPGVELTLTRVAGFKDFAAEEDHFRFEEVLYRWVLASASDPASRFFCLSGGFKTMAAAMQKAAAVLGAAEVFHVLADQCLQGPGGRMRFPDTIEEVQAAAEGGHLKWIRLGPESGWPQLRSATPEDYPLTTDREELGVRWARSDDGRFRRRLHEIVERSHHIAGAWNDLHDLPFTELATWSEADLAWLHQPLDPGSALDRAWVSGLPKVELHSHLGGFATSGELLERVRLAAESPDSLPPVRTIELPLQWPLRSQPTGLEPYRHLGDNNGSTLLRDPGCLRRQCELLYQHLLGQRVQYAEIRCSPANYADAGRKRSPWDVLTDIRGAFQTAMEQAGEHRRTDASAPQPCRVNLVVIGTRQPGGDFRAGISRHLALAVTAAEHWCDPGACRIVGVDLAGFEDSSTRAHYFREEFTAVHRCGLALTVHAGENDDAEGIWRAVFDLNARRLGHALSLAQSPELLRSVTDRGIGIEMCPYANLQIRGYPLDTAVAAAAPEQRYPLLDYLRAGARVTVNTDNIGISSATLTENLLLAARLGPGLTRLELLRLQRHAIEAAFLNANDRILLTQQFAGAIPLP